MSNAAITVIALAGIGAGILAEFGADAAPGLFLASMFGGIGWLMYHVVTE